MKITTSRYTFPQIVVDRVAKHYPLATVDNISLVFEAFLNFVDLCKEYPDSEIPMFSQSVDNVWHELIMDTRSYQKFCDEYVGYFLHHVPNGNSSFNVHEERKKLKALFLLACKHEGKDPLYEVPTLFKADEEVVAFQRINLQALKMGIIKDIHDKGKKPSFIQRTAETLGLKPKRDYAGSSSDNLSYDYLLMNAFIFSDDSYENKVEIPELNYHSSGSFERTLEEAIKNFSNPVVSSPVKPSSQEFSGHSKYHSNYDSSSSSSDHSSHSSHSSHSCGSSSHTSHSSCSSSSSSCSSSSSSSCSSSSCSS